MNCTVRSYSGFDHIYKVGFNALWGNRLFGNATWTNWNIHQYNNGALQTHRSPRRCTIKCHGFTIQNVIIEVDQTQGNLESVTVSDQILIDLKLGRYGKESRKKERIFDLFCNYNNNDLRDICRNYQLNVGGIKEDLVKRIINHEGNDLV